MLHFIVRLFEPLLQLPLSAPQRHRHSGGQSTTEARKRRQRRRALWLAVHGIDVGPRVIHGMKVA